MKKLFFTIALFLVAFTSGNHLTAQNFKGLDKSPMDAASYPSSYKIPNKAIKVTYGRPQLKGRKVSQLAPLGKVWRTGANEASEITFYKDVIFGGKAVKAGTYSLFTIPKEKEWTVILSTAKNVWGSYFYKKEEDVVRVSGTLSESKEVIEAFSMVFDDSMTLHLGWGNTVVSVAIK
jgi:hypothetical protein